MVTPVACCAPQVEKELKERAGGDAEAAFEAAKQAAAENATAEAEAALAAQREQYEAAVAAAEVGSLCACCCCMYVMSCRVSAHKLNKTSRCTGMPSVHQSAYCEVLLV